MQTQVARPHGTVRAPIILVTGVISSPRASKRFWGAELYLLLPKP